MNSNSLKLPIQSFERRPYRLPINKFLPFILIYFFVNNVGLPHGLQYTTILSPLFYVWLRSKGEHFIILKYILLFLPFVVAHFYGGVNVYFYIRSYVLLILIYVTVYGACKMMRHMQRPERIFDQIITVNFAMSCLALLILKTPYSTPIWIHQVITHGAGLVPRLRLLTYEASYYATLMVPFFVFAVSRVIYVPCKRYFRILVMTAFPMALAFSLGVLASLAIAISIVISCKIKKIAKKPILILCIAVFSLGMGFYLQGNNMLALRIHNVISGKDSSGNVRTVRANLLSYRIAESTNLWWGAGFGQPKIVIPEVMDMNRFNYQFRITNVVASTMATFGIIGLLLRFGAELFFFFKTRVYASSFRAILFLFMFIYQFTGSYLTNLAEYIIWMFAFIPVFMDFESPLVPLCQNRCRVKGVEKPSVLAG